MSLPRTRRTRRAPSPARLLRFRAPLLVSTLATGALVLTVPPLSHADDDHAPAVRPSPARDADRCRESDRGWSPAAVRVDPADSHHAYTGNGYLGVRIPPSGSGYAEEGTPTGWPLYGPRYDGSFVTGLYAHEPATTAGRQVLAALPTWTTLDVRAGDGTSASAPGGRARISAYRQSLLLRCGVVVTRLRRTTADGRATDLVYEVLTDRSDPHVGAVRLTLTPRWSGTAVIGADPDWRGARRLTRTGTDGSAGARVVSFRAHGTGTTGAVASVLRLPRPSGGARTNAPGEPSRTDSSPAPGTIPSVARADGSHTVTLRAGVTYTVVKYVGVDTSRTATAPGPAALGAARRAAGRGWDALYAANAAAWAKLWAAGVDVPGDPALQLWLRAARYGLLTAVREGAADSVAPAGLSSDDYAGLVFWDADTWMFPGLLATDPELARTVVEYRHRTRPAAARNADKLRFQGLFFPWTSGGTGDVWTECQSWYPPHCVTQNHLQSDVALAAWQFYLATGDRAWLRERGWPLLRGIAEFWASRVTATADGGYSVREVAGPDEYSNGVTDAVFTNAGAATALRAATRAAALVGEPAPGSWTRIADRIRIPYDAERKIYLQYAGYTGSAIKQADTVLLTYPLEWPMPAGAAAATLDYYAARTDPDGPAMTDSVHAIDAAVVGAPGCATYTYLRRAVEPFVRGPFALFSEAKGDRAGADDPLSGSPAQDFLTAKGGFLQVFTHGLTGLRPREDGVRLDPLLPPQLAAGVTVRGLRWQGRVYDIALGARETTVRLRSGEPFTVHTPAGERLLESTLTLPTRRPDLAPTDNAARCRAATASSEQPGRYAPAAVDGSPATAWVPADATAALTVDLGRTVPVASVTPGWTGPKPAAYEIETSRDGARWQPWRAGAAVRHVRVRVRAPAGRTRTGIGELTVRTS
ncbi:discoidin domain-containing protein [Streptomyces sp. NRRL F-5135]|uniref:discoidin domain-containing protein n=1 Tax=Streptomyces sp. NRRL F-5135 TaxID=1463858 RepID=UPI000AD2484F|nr:discoidin domain-containing protein [Streptomyces sp. NRRL F-5135]